MIKTLLLSMFIASSVFAQVDRHATKATKELFKRLDKISLNFRKEQKILLGHQNGFLEGRGWRANTSPIGSPLRSDMYDAVGVHPAVFGLDFIEVTKLSKPVYIDRIRQTHNKGGVITLSWHVNTVVDDGIGDNNSLDVSTRVVEHIIPGGSHHSKFVAQLDGLARFLNEISDVPVIFRPWHEHNYSWFWWGADHSTIAEYITLWKFTVDYLKSKGVHNLLYAYSPNHLKDDYFQRYPGNDYVDILGVDMYFKNPADDAWDIGENPLWQWKQKVVWFLKEAHKRDKIPVISEFGQEGIKYDRFWTDYFAWPLLHKGISQFTSRHDMPKRGVAYVLLWRNAPENPVHFFAPIIGHPLNDNFIQMLQWKIFQGL